MWLAAGLVLVVAELATPGGFVIIFFGIGALAVGALALLGLVTYRAAPISVFSVLLCGVARVPPRTRAIPHPDSPVVDRRFTGRRAWRWSRSAMAPRAIGRVEVRGSMWGARNTSDVTLDPGQRARVAAVDGLTLASFPNRALASRRTLTSQKPRRSA